LQRLEFLTTELGCKVTYASGSLHRFWENKRIKQVSGFSGKPISLISEEFVNKAKQLERKRVIVEYNSTPLNLKGVVNLLCKEVSLDQGPLISVFNTIKTTANIALALKDELGSERVLHLSTCLTPEHREIILKEVIEKIKRNETFILVATTCVEFGLDLSFKKGFREIGPVINILQLLGRINRDDIFDCDSLTVLELRDILHFSKNPQFANGTNIFRDLWRETGGEIEPHLANIAIERELQRGFSRIKGAKHSFTIEGLAKLEREMKMELIGECCRVIKDPKITVVIGEVEFSDKSLTRNSVSIYENKLEKCPNLARKNDEGILIWQGEYQEPSLPYPFALGIMSDIRMRN